MLMHIEPYISLELCSRLDLLSVTALRVYLLLQTLPEVSEVQRNQDSLLVYRWGNIDKLYDLISSDTQLNPHTCWQSAS
jgi:hypothetical protein